MNSTLLDFSPLRGEWEGEHRVVECSRALRPYSADPRIDFILDPYGGCEHGCLHCRSPAFSRGDHGSRKAVEVRSGTDRRLSRELRAVEGRSIGMGISADPYQYAERRFLLTRACLEAISPGRVRLAVFTRSDLVARDADALRDLGAQAVVSVPTLDASLSKVLEPGAPAPEDRLAAVSELAEGGVDVAVDVRPAVSFLEGSEKELIEAIASSGARRVMASAPGHADAPAMRDAGISPSESAVSAIELECLRLGLGFSRSFNV